MDGLNPPSRRGMFAGFAGLILAGPVKAATADRPSVTVTKDPSCGCCGAWVEHLQSAGFPVTVVTAPVNPLKTRLGVPPALASCHTAQVGGYVVEGHVPAGAVVRLLEEGPAARGLAVPGMPVGSPGMEVDGVDPDTYDVVLFGTFGTRTFARYRGPDRL